MSGRSSRPIASPDKIQFAEGLPKTRSGKIMRRILVKIANGDVSNLGILPHWQTRVSSKHWFTKEYKYILFD